MTRHTGKFTAGHNPGTGTCVVCRRTRQMANIATDTGEGLICVDCFDKAGDENAVADGDLTTADFHKRYGTHAWSCEYAGCDIKEATK